MTKLFDKQFSIILVVLLFTLPVFKSILRPGYFPMHDDFQAIRLLEMDKCIKDGQIPCRWVPDMGFGYGYPQFNYYAPLPYYVMEVFHLAGMGYLDSVKAFMVFITLISSLGMFLFARSLWGNVGGLISSITYTYLPYRAVDMYVRGAVGELSAMAILPFVFWSVRGVSQGARKATLWFALSLALLFISHNIASLITIPLLIIWFAFLLLIEHSTSNIRLTAIKNFSLGFFLGLALSAFFVLPAWFERKYVHIETLTSGYFNYLAHFLDIKQILFSNNWGYGTSQLGGGDDISLSIGIPQWILPLLAGVLLLIFKKRKQFLYASFFAVLGLAALFLTHSKSTIIWDNISLFEYIQFPWRFLLFSGFTFSLASGSLATLFTTNKTAIFLVSILFLVVYWLYGSYFRPKEWLSIKDSDKFSGDLWTRQITASIYDYLPIFAKKAPDKEASQKPLIIEGTGKVLGGAKGTNWQDWKIEVSSDYITLELQVFYYPQWRTLVDGAGVDIDYENDLGLITFRLPQGEHKVEVKLKDTPIRTISNAISLLSLSSVLLLRKKL